MHSIKLNKQKSEICEALNLSEEQFFASVQRLVENGNKISKNYIKMLCDIETVDFNHLRSNISDETLHCGLLDDDMLKEIQHNYQQSTEVELNLKFIRLMVSYYKVRDYLNQSNISYFDFDNQCLRNPMKLIVAERPIPNQNYVENVQPYPIQNRGRFSNFYEDNILDLMFPELRGYICNDFDKCY